MEQSLKIKIVERAKADALKFYEPQQQKIHELIKKIDNEEQRKCYQLRSTRITTQQAKEMASAHYKNQRDELAKKQYALNKKVKRKAKTLLLKYLDTAFQENAYSEKKKILEAMQNAWKTEGQFEYKGVIYLRGQYNHGKGMAILISHYHELQNILKTITPKED